MVRRAAATPATRQLRAAGVDFTEHRYDSDPRASSYGGQAVEHLGGRGGIPPTAIHKTLFVECDGRPVVVLVPVDRQVDLKAVAGVVGAKRAALAEAEEVHRLTGYVRGGVSPFGQRRQYPTVLDAAALGHERIYLSGGLRGYHLGVAPTDLVRLLDAQVAAVAR